MLIYLASCHVCSLYSILVCLSFPVDIIDKADTIEYRMILPNHKIKPWNQFIKISDSKINFIRFLCNERKNIYFWWRMFHSYSWKRQRGVIFWIQPRRSRHANFFTCQENFTIWNVLLQFTKTLTFFQ